MGFRLLSRFVLVSLLLAALAGLLRADVVYVDASGNGDFLQVQPAIDAALDGDVILVRSGTYPGFTIDQARVFVIADAGALVKVASKVTIKNTSTNGLVLLAGLDIEGLKTYVAAEQIGLEILNNSGHVRIQGCNVRGGMGYDNGVMGLPGGNASSIVNSSKVAFAACSLTGGTGGGIPLWVVQGGDGGHGVVEQGSAVAFYDCLLKGGVGGQADYLAPKFSAGDGGDGCRALDFGIFASGCQFQGGTGGGEAWTPGDGGDGLVVNPGAQAQLLSNTFAGGQGGFSFHGSFGQTGLPQSGGGVFHHFSGAARKLQASVLAAENASLQIQLSGEPGDRFWLASSATPVFIYMPAYAGIQLVPLPVFLANRPLTILPASGTATLVLPTPNVASGLPVHRQFLQGVVLSASGQVRLSSPLHVVVLNCSDLLPDCNGNQSCDSCDLLSPTVIDCDKNGVPDECQPDCNGNGLADLCDIASGTSLDQNHNGIPDECEPQTTWHIDASAAPGGNGSAGAPFQTIGEAFALAIGGDSVRVANGVYQGPGNRELNFNGRDFVVESSGGAVNCIIDCQFQGRAFSVGSGVTLAARIEGFTVRNGKAIGTPAFGGGIQIQGGSPTVRRIVFENCEAPLGGGLGMQNSSAWIEGCQFDSNRAQTGMGGGLYYGFAANARVLDCDFVNNQAVNGGAMGSYHSISHVERCVYEGNTASAPGGAIYAYYGEMLIDQCRIAGNAAPYGGGLAGSGSKWRLSNCTLVDNRASLRAGAAFFWQDSAQIRTLRNCIFWNNSSPSGTPFEVDKGPLDVAWCDLQGGQASITLGPTAGLNWGAGNLDVDPLFVDADGPDNDPLTLFDNDYRLALASACLDAGENASVALDWFDLDGDGNALEPVPFDFDGQPRFADIPSAPNTGSGTPPLVDLGAWERQP